MGVDLCDLDFLVPRDFLGLVFVCAFAFAISLLLFFLFALLLFAWGDFERVWDYDIPTPVLTHYYYFAVLQDNFLAGLDAVPQQGSQYLRGLEEMIKVAMEYDPPIMVEIKDLSLYKKNDGQEGLFKFSIGRQFSPKSTE